MLTAVGWSSVLDARLMSKGKPKLSQHKADAICFYQFCRNSTTPHKEMNKIETTTMTTLSANRDRRRCSCVLGASWGGMIDFVTQSPPHQHPHPFVPIRVQCNVNNYQSFHCSNLVKLKHFPLFHNHLSTLTLFDIKTCRRLETKSDSFLYQ